MSKITYTDRTDARTPTGATTESAAAIYNEIKTSVNALYDGTLTSNVWYVNTAGSDSTGDGSSVNPFKGLMAVHAVCIANNVV